MRIGADIAYGIDAFLPFVGLEYLNDVTRENLVVATGQAQPSNDDDEFLFNAGLRYFTPGGMTASLLYSRNLGRDDLDTDTVSLYLRAQW